MSDNSGSYSPIGEIRFVDTTRSGAGTRHATQIPLRRRPVLARVSEPTKTPDTAAGHKQDRCHCTLHLESDSEQSIHSPNPLESDPSAIELLPACAALPDSAALHCRADDLPKSQNDYRIGHLTRYTAPPSGCCTTYHYAESPGNSHCLEPGNVVSCQSILGAVHL